MARSSVTQRGRRRHTRKVQAAAAELVQRRDELEGNWTGRNEELQLALGETAMSSAELADSAERMDVDGASRRVRCAEAIQTALVNLRPQNPLGQE